MSDKVIKDASSLGQFHSAIAQICEEKGLNKDSVISTIESALAAAYKKDYGKKGQIIVSHIDPKSGGAKFKQLKEVVDESVRNMEDLEKIEIDKDGFLEEAKVSKEQIESRSLQLLDDENDYLPKFNNDKDVLLKDAKKVDKKIKIGDFLEVKLQSEGDYGRVASQTAKQVIIQRLREAERNAMFKEYKSKEGEIINGSVHRVEGRNVYIDLGKSIGVLYPSEQIPGEYYRIGQRLRVYIKKVEEDNRGSGITLSRASVGLVEKLFELEVPEIFTKVIEIKASAREAGNRTKIAVVSNDEDIDPIGSCVGQKGTRVQAVIEELGGERIDIIEWNEKPEKLIGSALSPAKVIKVELNEETGEATAFVEKEQLSLAIGQKGQNVRLAAKLTGWKIDVAVVGEEKGKDEKDEKKGKEEKAKDKKDDKKEPKKKKEAGKEKKDKKVTKEEEKTEKPKSKKAPAKKDKKEEKPVKEVLEGEPEDPAKDPIRQSDEEIREGLAEKITEKSDVKEEKKKPAKEKAAKKSEKKSSNKAKADKK